MGDTKGGQSAPILTLSSKLPPRDTIAIDGAEHELARYHDLSLHQHGKFSRDYLKALELYGELVAEDAYGLSDEDAAFLEGRIAEAATDAAMRVVRKCPREELEKLTVEQRMEICSAFQRAVRLWKAAQRAPRAMATATETGDASSTPSPPASGEDPAGGSDAPASESSLTPTGD